MPRSRQQRVTGRRPQVIWQLEHRCGKTNNIHLQVPISGTVNRLVDVLQNQYNRPLPAADLLQWWLSSCH